MGTEQKLTGCEDIVAGKGEMGALMRDSFGDASRSLDWSQTLLGAVENWSPNLRIAFSICLNSRFPMVIWWGKELVLLYNDAWRPILGTKHPQALGRPGKEVWSEIWDIIGVQLQSVLDTGEATWSDDMLLLVDRYGYIEEAYFTYSHSPIFLETGEVGGAFTAVTETTQRVIGDRRLHTLRELAANTTEAKTVEDACEISAQTLANNPYDVPFALLYLLDDRGSRAQLGGTTRLAPGTPASPPEIEMGSEICDRWSLSTVLADGKSQLVHDLKSKFGDLHGGAWPESPKYAFVLPLTTPGQVRLSGFLIAGISPRRQFDDDYQGFWDLVAGQITTAIANARASSTSIPTTLGSISDVEEASPWGDEGDERDKGDKIINYPLPQTARILLRQAVRKQEQALRMEAEAALRQSQELFQQMADTIESVFWLSDPQAPQMLYVSPAYEKIWGRSCESLYADSKSWMETIHPDDREQVQMAGAQCLAKGNHTEEYRILRPDGTIRWIRDRGFLVRDRHGQPYRIAGVAEDISDVYDELRLRKQAEQEREELLVRERAVREEAERANRIKDEFLAVLSHELRSPLNPILGWSKLLQNGKLNAVQTAEALATIERNANLQAQLIEDLLDVSRILRGKLGLNAMPLDLGRVINSALETVQLAAEAKSLEIHTNISPMVSAIGDVTRLQQVVWNILANAVKFTPPGGKIEVDLTPVGSNAQIRVKDTGKGIRPEFLPYVFDHFQQEDGSTTRQFGGLGLGLAIVRQLVELHGGTVAVESPGEGQGATFTVQIPLSEDAIIPQATLPPSNQRSPNLSGIHILVVDDEPDCREFLTFVLTQEQATVTAVSSGLAALNAINQAVPDILISDIGMPEMDGYMLMQNIRASPHGKSIPAIALTAYAGEVNQQKAIAAGFQRHIVKPVDANVAIAIVVELVRQKQMNN